jgi:hypothetical protein
MTEFDLEGAALDWLGYSLDQGAELAPDQATSERTSYTEVVLLDRLQAAQPRLRPRSGLAQGSARSHTLAGPDQPHLPPHAA